jgi:predicted amidophosphoribosyltransferase
LVDPTWLPKYAREVREQIERYGRFPRLFGKETFLVPVPGSAALATSRLWAAERLAFALHQMGLGREVRTCLRRVSSVRRSASSAAGQRPHVYEHYASFVVDVPACARDGLPERILLVDDVITKGRTLLAAAARLREAFPSTHIQAFALVRTLKPGEPVRHLLNPCEGVVRWGGGDARREP